MFAMVLLLAGLVRFGADARAADQARFQVRAVVEEGDKAPAERLEFLKPRVGGESALLVAKESLVDSKDVAKAWVESDPGSGSTQEVVRVRFTPEGKKKFAAATKAHIRKRLAIVVDKKIVLAPMVNEEISGGELTISGALKGEEVQAIAKTLSPEKK